MSFVVAYLHVRLLRAVSFCRKKGVSRVPRLACTLFVLIAFWTFEGPLVLGQGATARGLETVAQVQTGGTVVNTTTASDQQNPSVAARPTGTYVVAWESLAEDGISYGVYAQRFAGNGTAVGSQIQVKSTLNGSQQHPAVAVLPDGNFGIAWMEDDSGTWQINFQRYAADGTPQGDAVALTSGSDYYKMPALTAAGASTFVVTWQRIAADGSSFAIESVTVNAAILGMPGTTQTVASGATWVGEPTVDGARTSGRFVIAWQGHDGDGSKGVFAQRFTAGGTADGAAITVPSTTTGDQFDPGVAINDATDAFVVTYASGTALATADVLMRRFNADGSPAAAAATINTTTANVQRRPRPTIAHGVGSLASEVTIAWDSYGQDGSFTGVYYQRYDSLGQANGTETIASSITDGFQEDVALVHPAAGTPLRILWQGGNRIEFPNPNTAYDVYAYSLFSFEIDKVTVNSTDDDADAFPGDGQCDTGQTSSQGATECTLRAALQELNSLAGGDSVHFEIPLIDTGCSSGTCLIQPVAALPDITVTSYIDGATQGGNETVCSTTIPNRPTYAIAIDGANASSNANGLVFAAGSNNSLVRGLNIRGFAGTGGGNGVSFNNSSNSRLHCSFLGTDATGTNAVANRYHGVEVAGGSSGVIIGTDGDGANDAFEGNLLSGNTLRGVRLNGSSNTIVAGNYIGTTKSGAAALPNAERGLHIDGGATNDRIGTNADGVSDALEANVISGNTQQGLMLSGSGTVFAGNIIGLDAGGTSAVANGQEGIRLSGATDNRIGSDGDGTRDAVEGNTISNNGGNGIVIVGNTTLGNSIVRNRIFDNTGLGIDLNLDGATANDVADTDTGPNRLQNMPTLHSSTYNGTTLSVSYSVASTPGTVDGESRYPLRIDFYRADGGGEGKDWLGSDTYAATDQSNGPIKLAAFTPATVSPTLLGSDQLIATATDADGNTSEFSTPSVNLPVELTLFDVVQHSNAVVLRWTTTTETNNAGFAVEHQHPAGPTWMEIAFINGRGTTLQEQTYQFRHTTTDPGVHRFRLRQVDFDGTVTYSSEVELTIALVEAYRFTEAYPNPTQGQALLRLMVRDPQRVRVALYDVLGKQVALVFDRSLAGNTQHLLSVSGDALSSGLYFVRAEGEHFRAIRQLTITR